uniref:F-box domain-containing protein n=1 Tax=Setaria italica TaxID=4555 RepID=K3YLK7_SETIT
KTRDCSRTGDLDRISALPDDLLHVILGFLADAHAVTSTAVLSRRWRRVWVHAKNLAFTDRLEKYAVPTHFAGFVDWALAQRDDSGIKSLKICVSRTGSGSGCTSLEQVNEWLRYAGRRVAGFLELQLGAPTDRRHAVELPSHGRATSIQLTLLKHRLRLPAATAARYEALTELSLSSPVFAGAGTLGDLPRRLRQLVLRSEALGELEVTLALDLRTLDMTAPSLRAVRLTLCFHNPMRGIEDAAAGKVARIAAPRLEEISMHHCFRDAPPPELDIHDLASVRRLDKLWLEMHGKRCPGVEHVDAWLHHYEEKPDAAIADDEFVDLTAQGAPPFANVRSMELSAWCLPARDLVPSVSSLLMRAHEEMQLVTTLFERSKNSIRRMTLGGVTQIKPKTIHLKWNTAEEDGGDDDDDDDTDTIDEQLMKIPITDRGCWHFAKEVFTWMNVERRTKQREVGSIVSNKIS